MAEDQELLPEGDYLFKARGHDYNFKPLPYKFNLAEG